MEKKKTIYTSNFAKAVKRRLPNPVDITRRGSRYYQKEKFDKVIELAPSDALLDDWNKGKIDEKEYTKRYFSELRKNKITPQAIIKNPRPVIIGGSIIFGE